MKVGNLYYQGSRKGLGDNSAKPFTYIDSNYQFVWEITAVPDGYADRSVILPNNQVKEANPVQLIALNNIKLEEIPSLYSKYLVYKRDYDIFTTANGIGNAKRISFHQHQPQEQQSDWAYHRRRHHDVQIYAYITTQVADSVQAHGHDAILDVYVLHDIHESAVARHQHFTISWDDLCSHHHAQV